MGPLALNDVAAFPHRNDEKNLLVSLQRLHRTLFRAERFKVGTPLPYSANLFLTEMHQASALITKPDVSLHNSDHLALSPDSPPEYNDSEHFEGLDHSDETAFVDLFTESESSQDTANMVCECLLPAPHLTHNSGCVICDFHIYRSSTTAEILMLLITSLKCLTQKKQPLFSKEIQMSLLSLDLTTTGIRLTCGRASS